MKKPVKYYDHLRQSSFDLPHSRFLKNFPQDTKTRQHIFNAISPTLTINDASQTTNSRTIGQYPVTIQSKPSQSNLSRLQAPLNQRKQDSNHQSSINKYDPQQSINESQKKSFSPRTTSNLFNNPLSPKWNQGQPQLFDNSLKTPSSSSQSSAAVTPHIATPTNQSPYEYYQPQIECSTERKRPKPVFGLDSSQVNKSEGQNQLNYRIGSQQPNFNLSQQQQTPQQIQQIKTSLQQSSAQPSQNHLQLRQGRNETSIPQNPSDRVSQSIDISVKSIKKPQINQDRLAFSTFNQIKLDSATKTTSSAAKKKPEFKMIEKPDNDPKQSTNSMNSNQFNQKLQNSLQFKNLNSIQKDEIVQSPPRKQAPVIELKSPAKEEVKDVPSRFEPQNNQTSETRKPNFNDIISSYPFKQNNYFISNSEEQQAIPIANRSIKPQGPSSNSQSSNGSNGIPISASQIVFHPFSPSNQQQIQIQQQSQQQNQQAHIIKSKGESKLEGGYSSMFFRPSSPQVQIGKQQQDRFEQQLYFSQIFNNKNPSLPLNSHSIPTDNSIIKPIITNKQDSTQLKSDLLDAYNRPDYKDLNRDLYTLDKPNINPTEGIHGSYKLATSMILSPQKQSQHQQTEKLPLNSMIQSNYVENAYNVQLKEEPLYQDQQVQRRKSDPINIRSNLIAQYPKNSDLNTNKLPNIVSQSFDPNQQLKHQSQNVTFSPIQALPNHVESVIPSSPKTKTTIVSNSKQIGRIKTISSETEESRQYTKFSFDFLRLLGEGVFGSVYMVRDKKTKGVYALKQISKRLVAEKQMMPQLQRELQIHQNSCHHENILQCLSSFEDDHYFYLLLEYADGGTCSELISKHPERRLKEQDASRLVLELLLALNYLNSQSIIHRDIKLENILLSNGQLKLSDFGCATFQDAKSQKRRSFCGTIDYISPEMVKDQVYDREIDVWALGVIAYELVSGMSPFSDNFKSFLTKIFVRDPRKRATVSELLKHPWISSHLPLIKQNFSLSSSTK